MKTCEGIINDHYSPRRGEPCGRPTSGPEERFCGYHAPEKREAQAQRREASWQKQRQALGDVMRVDAGKDKLVVEVLRTPKGEELKFILSAIRRALRQGKSAVLAVALEGA